VKNLCIKHLKVSNTATFKKLSFYHFPSSLLTYILNFKTPSVIPFWRAFLMPLKGAWSKVPLSSHFKWLSQCLYWFTKSGCHLRILKLETWNFAWDLISPIHMLYKKRGSIWELFEKLAQPSSHLYFTQENINKLKSLKVAKWRMLKDVEGCWRMMKDDEGWWRMMKDDEGWW